MGGGTRSWGAQKCPIASPAPSTQSPKPARRCALFCRLQCHNAFRSFGSGGPQGQRTRNGTFPANRKNEGYDVAMAAPRSLRLALELFCLYGCRAGSARYARCKIFLFFLVSTHSLVVERFVYPDRMSSGLALILQIIHLQL